MLLVVDLGVVMNFSPSPRMDLAVCGAMYFSVRLWKGRSVNSGEVRCGGAMCSDLH